MDDVLIGCVLQSEERPRESYNETEQVEKEKETEKRKNNGESVSD